MNTVRAPRSTRPADLRAVAVDAALPVALVATTYWVPPRVLTFLAVEDALFEWIQVAVLAVGAVLAGLAAVRGRRLSLAPAALVMAAIAGEELAWGTRLLRFNGLSGVQALNDQGDLTLHNLGEHGLEASFAALAVLGLAGAAYVIRRGLPPALAVWFTLPALYAVVRASGGVPHWRFAKLSEALELVLYAAMLRVVLRARRSAPAVVLDEAVPAVP